MRYESISALELRMRGDGVLYRICVCRVAGQCEINGQRGKVLGKHADYAHNNCNTFDDSLYPQVSGQRLLIVRCHACKTHLLLQILRVVIFFAHELDGTRVRLCPASTFQNLFHSVA